MTHECFVDEIAIDFPSAGRVVERMLDSVRAAFPGESASHDLFEAELPLSPREAFAGRVLPLSVPIRGACAGCGGRGESWAEPCARCAGSGEQLFHHTVDVAVPPRVTDGATLRFRVTSRQTGSVRVNLRIAIQESLV
ncbi:MAG TPA: hypothetical protein VN628_13745 [Vicinamibacterales bacterium]|nr:hypothetical protein [Vicinamibacterales bacterium]